MAVMVEMRAPVILVPVAGQRQYDGSDHHVVVTHSSTL